MSEQFDTSHQESNSDCEPNLSELKKEVEITPSTLKDITSKEEFIERVIQLSNNAKQSINVERAKQALIYLSEAEKILQYAASCGKTIDKYIIISVLHNEACCYQKIWELEKCSNYLEALIYNFNSFMKQNEGDEISLLRRKVSGIGREKLQKTRQILMAESIDKKTILAKYYLQFCAVNSQTDNHSGALIAGRKSMQILKTTFQELAQLATSLKKMTYQKKSEFEYKLKIIDYGSRINDAISLANYQTVLAATRYYLAQWRIIKDNKERPDRNYILEEQFKNYSIGNAMQIIPMVYREFQERDCRTVNSKMLVQKILLMALAYFTISTELRLIANKKAKREGDKSSAQFRESEIYHLLSIVIAAVCIPFDILYMKHILSSYNNHYSNDLQKQGDSKLASKFQQLIFPYNPVSIRKNTVTNSFSGSLSQEDSESKMDRQQTQQISSHQLIEKKHLNSNYSTNEKQQNKTKIKNKVKSKSKSKNKNMKSMTFLAGKQQKSEKASPVPKSPNVHLKSPTPKNNLIKVKTSYKLKLSTQKIVTTNNIKQDRSRRKKQTRTDNIDFDYFMGKSKDLKKMKKTIQMGMNLASPRNNGSKSSSRRQSPLPKYFEQLKPNVRNIKSPKKNTNKLTKANYHQYYL